MSMIGLAFIPNGVQEHLEDWKDLVIEESVKYFKDTIEHVVIGILAYFCLCVVFYFITVYLDTLPKYGHVRPVKNVLFITAHPDDECMFFGPTILKLTKKKECNVFLMCLSDGNYDKKGPTRKMELWDACKLLGIPDSNVIIMKNEFLPDNPAIRWREEIVAGFVLNHIEAYSVDTVMTFDRTGVSRHQNHISLFYALAYLCMEKKLPSYCRAYALESINILRKYSFCLDLPISYVLSSFWYIASFQERKTLRAAMKAHRSQYVWFRKLYMRFSRYTYINTYKEIEIVDLELDLDLED